MTQATNLGYPRMGKQRELKKALESFWAGALSAAALQEQARDLRRAHWLLQQRLGIQQIPSNDFSLYDQVLDTIALVGAVPERYRWTGAQVDLATYFAMARGGRIGQDADLPAMEMTKWFDTNYHYIVPEFTAQQNFRLASTKPLDEFKEALALSVQTRPVLLGPVSFLLLGKLHHQNAAPLSLLERLLPIYEEVLRLLAEAGAEWVQLDEPCLVLDLDDEVLTAMQRAYTRLSGAAPSLKILLATYFGDLGPWLPPVLHLPVAAVHLDLVRGKEQLAQVLAEAPASLTLSLGVVDGRNIWRTDLHQALALVTQAVQAVGSERVLLGPSCSLLHVPADVTQETRLDAVVGQWLAFAEQKLEELVVLTRASNEGIASVSAELEASQQALQARRTSAKVHREQVRQQTQAVIGQPAGRKSSYTERKQVQQTHLHLPLLPTTTIGSFPQTKAVRSARAAYTSGKTTAEEYDAFVRQEIEQTIRFQEEIGLDVLVHGEFERSDMVEYFGEQLGGFLFTQHGWMQSYGSRCVRPPIIYGDIERSAPMTVRWSCFAQSLTTRPVKGMLTGPVTMLQWSFVRDDQPRWDTCYQLALALREEVHDLEAAGIRLIQIDEPALREGLPLRRSEWPAYLDWAVNCFRLVASGVRDETQIHTHMCYAEFQDIIEAITAMDADVISIEASRSQLALLKTFVTYRYPNGIGPGLYDIHSPRIPEQQEYEAILSKLLQVFPAEQLWVNPDCGLKTRRWEEVRPALARLVAAAQVLRAGRKATP